MTDRGGHGYDGGRFGAKVAGYVGARSELVRAIVNEPTEEGGLTTRTFEEKLEPGYYRLIAIRCEDVTKDCFACAFCRFSQLNANAQRICHRRAPTTECRDLATVRDPYDRIAFWNVVPDDGWCGDFQIAIPDGASDLVWFRVSDSEPNWRIGGGWQDPPAGCEPIPWEDPTRHVWIDHHRPTIYFRLGPVRALLIVRMHLADEV